MRRFATGKVKPETKPKENHSWVFSGSGYIITLPDGTEQRFEGRPPDKNAPLANADDPEFFDGEMEKLERASARREYFQKRATAKKGKGKSQ
jgi:hypothetical protein